MSAINEFVCFTYCQHHLGIQQCPEEARRAGVGGACGTRRGKAKPALKAPSMLMADNKNLIKQRKLPNLSLHT